MNGALQYQVAIKQLMITLLTKVIALEFLDLLYLN